MGQLWYKTDDVTWSPGRPVVRTATGWNNGRWLYRKLNPTTWSLVWTGDVTPPATPSAPVMTYNATTKVMSVKVTAPSTADTVRGRLKWSRTAYATSPTDTTDGQYYDLAHSVPQADGQAFSDFTLSPSEVKTKVTGPSGVAGQTQYVTFWVCDSSNNWSARAIASYKIPTPAATTPTVVAKSANFNPSDSGSWNGNSNYWRTDNNYVYQAGYNWYGGWFYGTQISAAVKSAKKITNMTIKVTRANTEHGVAGAANVRLVAHKQATQGTASPEANFSAATLVGTLTRGQTKTFTVPSAWWPSFITGTYKGLGLHYGTTSFTDVNYMYAYGNAVVHIEWQQ